MFLAGETIATARERPTAADLERARATGRYWHTDLAWFIRCDRCGVLMPYGRDDDNGPRRWRSEPRYPTYLRHECLTACKPGLAAVVGEQGSLFA